MKLQRRLRHQYLLTQTNCRKTKRLGTKTAPAKLIATKEEEPDSVARVVSLAISNARPELPARVESIESIDTEGNIATSEDGEAKEGESKSKEATKLAKVNNSETSDDNS